MVECKIIEKNLKILEGFVIRNKIELVGISSPNQKGEGVVILF